MIRKILKNKLVIIFLVTLMILGTFLSTKIFATEDVTNTVLSAEHDPSHEVNGGVYIPFVHLRDYYDYFCCYHGGVGSHIPSASDTILHSEVGDSSEGYLTQNDIGKKVFENTIDGENPESPFKKNDKDYTNQTYGYYKVKSEEICRPKEAYILAEMLENIPENALPEGWYTDIQKAWWTTTAGSHGAIKVPLGDLAIEAEAFRDYIVEAAGVTNEDEVPRNTVIEYEYNGQKKTLDCGFDIKYEPRFYDGSKEDVNKDNKVNAFDQVTVAWDSRKQVYKIGPFALDYIEASTQVGSRPEVMFAGIIDAKLYTDASDEPLERGKDWRFLWTNNRSDSEFPHTDEEFYIELDYIEGASKVTDLVFNFKYMNAAGKYQYLEGKYFTAFWKPQDKENYCPGGHLCRHGRINAHSYTAGYSNGKPITGHCSGGTPCEHGKYARHVASKTFWLQLDHLEENDSQLLGLGLNAARVENYKELHFDIDLEHSGKLKIEKKLVDENGNEIDSNRKFRFKIYIDGKFRETVSIKANSSVTRTYTWGADEDVPSYEVVEIKDPKYELIDIENATGDLSEGKTVHVIAKNKKITEEEHHGTLKIDKIVQGDIKDKEFEFKVVIGRDSYIVKISEATGWTWTSPEYTWKDDEKAPKYSVQEINLPEGVELIGITPSSGYLVDDEESSQVIVKAVNRGEDIPHGEYEHGKVRITKKLDGNAISSDTFKFKLTIDGGVAGHQEIYVDLQAGQTYQSEDFYWKKGEKPCTYKVEEIDIPNGSKLIDIENASGTLGSNQTVDVIAINELEEKSGKIKITKDIITDDKIQADAVEGTFTISVRISGTFEMNGESIVNGSRTITKDVKAGESFETPDIKWYGDEAPTYTVTETNMPEGWKLESISSSTGSLEENSTIDVVVLNKYTTKVIIDLTMEMAGDVWEDEPLNEEDKNTEDSVANGIYDRGVEDPINGVEVKIYWVPYKGDEALMDQKREATGYIDENKTPITFPIITGEDTEEGHWLAKRMAVPAVTKEEREQFGYTSARYYIEFTYDGQTYEPTEFLASGTRDEFFSGKESSSSATPSKNIREKYLNDSMALDENREEVDNRIAEVKGDTPIDEVTGMTNGKTVGTDGTEYNIKYTSRDNLNINRKISEVVTRDESSNRPLDPFRARATTAVGNLFYPFDERVHLEGWDKTITELGEVVQTYYYSATYPYTQHINLGLVKRKSADISAVKDLVSAKVAVNGKVVEYKYNKLLDKFTETPTDSQIVTAQNEVTGYELKLYNSDYYYRTAIYKEANEELYNDLNNFYKELGLNEIKDREMDIYLKYRIDLYNTSEGGYDAEINELLDYYDDSFELVTEEVKKYVQTQTENGLQEELVTVAVPSTYNSDKPVAWTLSNETTEDVNGEKYKVMSTNSLDGYKIKAGERVSIDVTFKVTKATDSQNVQDAIRIEGIDKEKSNIVEVSNYSTYYKDSDKIAGKIDKDSAPDNVNLKLQKDGEMEAWFEDDTAAAPTLNVELNKPEESRDINGIAWEDKEEVKANDNYNEFVGNGIYDEDENKLGGLTTELYEKITVKHYDENGVVKKDEAGNDIYKEYDVLWPTEKPFDVLGGKTVNEITGGFSSKTETSSAVESEGEYNFKNVPAGDFVVRFTYGNKLLSHAPSNEKIKVFNGHDYKTTIYQTGFNKVNGEGITNNEWHDLKNKDLEESRVSDARDLETRRLEVIEKTKVMTNANSEILATANKEPNDLNNDTVHEKLFKEYYMQADTAKLNLEIENADGNSITGIVIDGQVTGKETEPIKYVVKNIDVGLEERSRNEIVLDKEISRITLKTNDGTVILDAKYDINYRPEIDNRTGKTTWKVDLKLNDSSIGIDQLQSLDKDEENGLQNFRYINVDNNILQGTTITMEYTFTALNIGEVDLIGEKLENFKTSEEIENAKVLLGKAITEYTKTSDGLFTRENLVGGYLGSTYYNGANAKDINKDVAATVKVRQLIDYVDNDATFAAKENMKVDNSWRTVIEPELLGEQDVVTGEYNDRVLSTTSGIFTVKDGNIDASVGSILDDREIKYNTENKTNIILSIDNDEDTEDLTNKGFMKKLVPYAVNKQDETKEYMSQIKLVTSRYVGADTNSEDMSFDNLAEIVKFESSVGKRDIETVPGNAKPSDGEFKTSLEERDTSATELITLTPPTGANLNKIIGIQLIVVILAGLSIVAIGIVVIKKKVLSK